MQRRTLRPWLIGLTLTIVAGVIGCGDDDTTGGPTGAGGGQGGSAGSSTTGNAGSAGSGGTASTGGGAGNGGSTATGGSAGFGGGAGTGGTADSGATPDGGLDASTSDASDSARSDAAADTSASDATSDVRSADRPDGSVAFADVTDIFGRRCSGCHRPRDAGFQLLDLVTADGLYARLTTPLPDAQQGKCGFGNGGTDGGDAAPSNRQPIVPSDPGASLLFLKLAGTQPAGCGVRMPRVAVTTEDGGPAGSVGCDLADGGAAERCVSQADLDTILHWIEQGAPSN